jgi:hypothetical protein
MTFVHEGVATFIQYDGVESSIRTVVSETFKYQSLSLSETLKILKLKF